MNETTEYQQKELYSYAELLQVADKIATEIAKELNDYYVHVTVEFGKIYIDIGTDFGEISYCIASRIHELLEHGEISEEDSNQLFDKFFREEIELINEEYCVYNEGKIETPKYIITFEPLKCLGDYCVVGLTAEVEFKNKVTDIDIGNIAQLIITVFRL